MPQYEYYCEKCCLITEKFLSATRYRDTCVCECGATAHIQLPGEVSYGSNVNMTQSSIGPQNTGLSSFDHEYDRVIAKDSRGKWESIKERQAYKRQILRDNPGVSGKQIAVTPDGGYVLESVEERQQADAIRDITRVTDRDSWFKTFDGQ